MKHVLSCTVQNQPGVLAHVAGMFSARGFNIDSLVVGPTEDPLLSRMVIVTRGDDATIEAVRKQLGRLVPVVRVRDMTKQQCVQRDLVLVKVACPPERRLELQALCDAFNAKVVDVGHKTLTLQLVGAGERNEAFIELVRPYGIRELSRTGLIAMPRALQAQSELEDDEAELDLSGRSMKQRNKSEIPEGIDISLIPPG